MANRRRTARSVIKRGSLAAAVALLAAAPLAAITWAEPASQVTPELITSALFKEPFKVRTAPDSPIEMQLKSKEQVRMYVRRHTYAPGGNTGWHKHPGPVFILVTKGELTYYDLDCQSERKVAGAVREVLRRRNRPHAAQEYALCARFGWVEDWYGVSWRVNRRTHGRPDL